MRLLKEYNILENKKVIIWLNVVAVVSMVLFFPLFIWIGNRYITETTRFSFDLLQTALVLVAYFGLIIIHELIHGAFFKLFHKEGKVKFGFKNGMAYATSPNSYYTKGKFAWIVLAPFVLITCALFLFAYIGVISSYLFVVLATLHAAACVGDFYFSVLLVRAPKGIYVKDTETGISFYMKH